MIKRLTLLLLGIAMLAQRPGGGGPHPGGNGDGHGDADSGYTPARSRGSEAPDLESHLDNVRDSLGHARTGSPGGYNGRTTTPSGRPDPNAAPRGPRTKTRGNQQLRRENETADIMARNGYDVEQNPDPKDNGREPDYKIEGHYWDNYAPDSPSVDTIRSGISNKVKTGQADSVTLRLDDTTVTQAELRHRLETRPIKGLREVKIISGDGTISHFYPF